ncbi:MAG: hypothetical protein M3173_00330 [Chloroflexota bacterium]|nr:hypothetical protein [Chloroflexota bacterium]
MRFLLKVSIPVEAGNAMNANGRIAEVIGSILADLQPEAAYFTPIDGKRGVYLVVEMEHASQLPSVAEPFFLALNASVEAVPVMTAEDLMQARPGIEQAVKQYSGA